MAAALLPARAPAADPVNLEGTWKISAPQPAFKPEGGSIPFTDVGRKRYAAEQTQPRQARLRRIRLRHGAMRIAGVAPADAHSGAFPHLAAARMGRRFSSSGIACCGKWIWAA
jgi:hypothetical protein